MVYYKFQDQQATFHVDFLNDNEIWGNIVFRKDYSQVKFRAKPIS